MTHYLLRCLAPKPFRPSETCNREFTAMSPYAIYCCPTCANRAHRKARMDKARAAGYAANVHPLATSIAAESRIKAIESDNLAAAATYASNRTTEDIERALTIQRLTAVDSEAELAAIGYSATKKAERWSESDRAAEPRKVIPTSDEDNPPQFDPVDTELDPDDPYATLNQPDTKDL